MMKLNKKLISVVFSLLILLNFTYAQNSEVISEVMAKGLKVKAKEAVENYYSGLKLIGSSTDPEIFQAYKEDALTFFDKSKEVRVFNDLSEGSHKLIAETYIDNMNILYSDEPAKVVGEILEATNIFFSVEDNFMLVKVVVRVNVKGLSNDGRIVDNTNKLDVFVKFRKNNGRIITSPAIYDILQHENEERLTAFRPIITTENEDEVTILENNEEYNRKMKVIEETRARLDAEKENIERQKNELAIRMDNARRQEDQNRLDSLRNVKAEYDAERKRLDAIRAKKIADDEAEAARIEGERAEAARIAAEVAHLESERKKELLKSNRFVINVGGGVYKHTGLLEQVVNKQEIAEGNFLVPQINAMLGYRFDFKSRAKMNRGTILGVFARYGLNSDDIIASNISNQTLLIAEDKRDAVLNPYMEVEAGFVFSEIFRASFGVGKQYDQKYYLSTLALNINIGKLIWEIGATSMYGKEFKKMQVRPFTSFAFQFNESNPKRVNLDKKGGFFTFDLNPEVAYNLLTDDIKGTAETNSMSYQLSGFTGMKLGGMKLGLFGTFGVAPLGLSQNIIEGKQMLDTISTNGDYNSYYGVEAGIIMKIIRLSYGIGEYAYAENKTVPFQSATLGLNVGLGIPTVRFTMNASVVALNDDFTRPIIRLSSGLLIRFNYAR